ncbi:hypothetical protein QWI29_00005, partial [Mycolicibacterium neoaurum]|uniref:hypothetical protein n=1 Tax=Mycolicibacterium neoaurum TaxID=1795 RepID=UPI002673A346
RPEPGSNSPNKNPSNNAEAEFESEKSDHKQKTPKTGIKKTNHLMWQEDGESPTKMAKNNKQKPPNTLLSSQTTRPIPTAQQVRG